MDYAKIPNHAIEISPLNRQHIGRFQRWSILQVILCVAFLLAASWVTKHHQGATFTGALQTPLGYAGVFAYVFLIAGLAMQVPRHIFLLFEFWKKQYLTISSLPSLIMKTAAWLLPGLFLLVIYAAYPELGWAEQTGLFLLASALVYVRITLMQCRFAAQEQYRRENPDPTHLIGPSRAKAGEC